MNDLILIVDDERDLVEALEYALQREGFRTSVASTGQQALTLAASPCPDLILLDLMLPDMAGTQVCLQLRADAATRAVPIVMMTAKAAEIDRVVGFEVGADDYVTKPFSVRELVLRVRAVLRRRALTPPSAGVVEFGRLLVDTDAQGNVGVSLGMKSERSLYHVLVMGLAGKDAVTTVRPGLDVLPSNETVAAAELYLAGRQNRDRVLASRLSQLARSYDHVIVDCSPSLSLMNQNALCLVDSVLVPVACDYLSLVGMRQVIKTVKSVNQLLHHPVRIWGILPTFYDARAKICHEAVETLKTHFGDRCLRPVRQAIKVKEAPAQGQTLWEYAPGSVAAEDYAYVVDRVLGIAAAGAAEAEPALATG